ncbi:MAG: hypothetical protein JW719_14755 [Pirellulales bacterium]|nr:hypothetical protein [Pirellulales bacterium]
MFAEVYRNYIENAPLPAKDRKLIHIEERLGFKQNRLAYFLGPNNAGRTMVLLLLPATEAVLEASTRSRGNLAATKIIVASRRYEIDHGELPPTLDSLVPDYLDVVPADPYDGRPMRYDRDRAIIYSVGEDLIDSGGSELMPGESIDDENVARWEAQDAVFHLHGRPETGKEEASVGQAMPDGRD